MLIALLVTFIVITAIAYSIELLAGIALSIICGGLFYLYRKYSRVLKSIKEEPLVTDSRVVAMSKKYQGTDEHDRDYYIYKIIVEFTPLTRTGEGKAVRLEVNVPEDYYDLCRVDDITPILYASANPRFATLKGEGQGWHSYWPE
jgi:hypothetical protein